MMVRSVTPADLPQVLAIDPDYTTEYVWQMEAREGDGSVAIAFRTVRLPRSMRVAYPRYPEALAEEFGRRDGLHLVAEDEGGIAGYLGLTLQPVSGAGWITHLAVARDKRRRGIGTALIDAATRWGREHGLTRLIVETQTKNYPAIHFCQRLGFAFCGYHDRYYRNQDIALFFARPIR
jgi:ribosomal protein S18 acetylase RimI-like enzyme